MGIEDAGGGGGVAGGLTGLGNVNTTTAQRKSMLADTPYSKEAVLTDWEVICFAHKRRSIVLLVYFCLCLHSSIHLIHINNIPY